MREGLTELVFILDRSGSMEGLERDTIGGFNSMIKKQQGEPGEALVSTVLFSDGTDVIHDRVALGHVRPLTDREYFVGGCTALLDAVGGSIRHIVDVHRYARPEDVPARTLFVITTDGQENASRRYRLGDVRRMIEHEREKYGWEFLFLGANIDAIEAAGRIGIDADHAADYLGDSAGTAGNFCAMSGAVSYVRSCKAPIGRAWKRDIEADVRRRGRRAAK